MVRVLGTMLVLLIIGEKAVLADECEAIGLTRVFFANGIDTATDDDARAQLNEIAATLDRIGNGRGSQDSKRDTEKRKQFVHRPVS